MWSTDCRCRNLVEVDDSPEPANLGDNDGNVVWIKLLLVISGGRVEEDEGQQGRRKEEKSRDLSSRDQQQVHQQDKLRQ
jgi:hypothetical protein